MHWAISRAVCACAWRRVRPALAENPLLAALAAFLVAAAPGAAFWAGARLSSAFAEAAADPAFVRALAVGLGLSAVVAGSSVALLAPGPEALGPQVAAAPRPRAALATGAVIVPVCVAACLPALVLACFVVPLAGSTGVELLLLALACASLGTALGEGVRLVAAGEPSGAPTFAAVALAWAAASSAHGGRVALGPIGAVDAERGLVALPAVAATGLVLWIVACGLARRERPPTRVARLRRLPARAGPAVALVTARRILRRPDLRLHGATAVVLPLGAALAAWAALGIVGAAASVFCVAVTLTAAALYPPAGLGLTRGGRWLLASAPRRGSAIAAAAAAGGVGAAAALLVAAALLSAPLGLPPASIYLELESASAFVLGCAVLSGAVVPWHPDRILHQVVSYVAVLGVVVAAWTAVGLLGRIVPDGTAFAVLAGNLMLALGVSAAAVLAR